MPTTFFDLSSGDAGLILQKVRTYRIRLAIVVSPQTTTMSSRFGDMLADERQGRDFGLFTTREEAVRWLLHNAHAAADESARERKSYL